MSDKSKQDATDLEMTTRKLERIIELGIRISAERDTLHLMETILLAAKELTNADGGTLYLRTEDEQLKFQIIHNDTLKIAWNATTGGESDFPPVPLHRADGSKNLNNVVSYAVHQQRTINIEDAYAADQFDFSGMRAFDERSGYHSKSFLTVPLKPRGGEIIGAFQLVNARAPGAQDIVAFSHDTQRYVEALAAQAATTLQNRILEDQQEQLMESLIELIAGAIDSKSPYTGGHCERVPQLAIMLAEAASEANDGVFADFKFGTEDEWREFRIGAWLHDCGKVTTPEFVIDKATKLETIHNRLHEIRTRFEVLLRDAEIAKLQQQLAGRPLEEATGEFEAEKARLVADFAFIAECNVGGEAMAPERILRLKEISKRNWVRHFDDRIGLSHGELSRLAAVPPQALPAIEPLIADKPEQVVARDRKEKVFDPRYGFAMDVPKNLFNFGEIYNLSVNRGTLTAEERYKINEHMVQTVVMLDQLPFPRNMRRVPEYASTHHETLIGTGYPRRLTGSQMSVPSRIMAIADIFEALTAADRPYKKGKTLSESIHILSRFRDDQHIDPDLFRLFLTSGVYLKYAKEFLAPHQIDEVDHSRFI